MEIQTEAINLGKSIIVPSVQELAKQPINKVPPRYARTDQDNSVISSDGVSIPVIDLDRLLSESFMEAELGNLHSACKEWGFFQVVNHGVDTSLLEEFKKEVEKFFKLPHEEKKKLWQSPDDQEGFGQLFVTSEDQKLDWSDIFYLTTLPLIQRKSHLFDKLPPVLRETLEAYSRETKSVAMVILDHLAKALKMDVEEMRQLFGEGIQAMRMNFYPPCPEPDKAIGLTPHSDADALTIVYQLNETDGLQIRKDGNWVAVRPLSNAFIVNVGDVLEIISNGVYKSIEHRATVNSSKERFSIATFHTSKLESELGPAKSLVGPNNRAVFRRLPFEKYLKDFFARELDGKSYLDLMRIENEEDE